MSVARLAALPAKAVKRNPRVSVVVSDIGDIAYDSRESHAPGAREIGDIMERVRRRKKTSLVLRLDAEMLARIDARRTHEQARDPSRVVTRAAVIRALLEAGLTAAR